LKGNVINMGGVVLEFDCDKVYEAGQLVGEERGERKGLFKAVYILQSKGYNEETACAMLDVKLEDYKKYKIGNKLKLKAVYILENNGYNEETACAMLNVKLEDYKEYKAEKM